MTLLPGIILPKDIIGHGAGHSKWVKCTFFAEDMEEIKAKKKAYFDQFPAQGYDTHTDGNITRHPDGYYFLRIIRWSSCD